MVFAKTMRSSSLVSAVLVLAGAEHVDRCDAALDVPCAKLRANDVYSFADTVAC